MSNTQVHARTMKTFSGEESKSIRSSIYPVLHKDIWDFYKTQQNCIWTAEEIDLEKDNRQFNDDKIFNDDERHFIMMTLSFFSGFDTLVIKNISINFQNEIDILECKMYYTVQNYIEGIHAETYGMLIDAIVPKNKKEEMFNSLENIESIKLKAEWACKYMDPGIPLAERMLAWAVVEGVFFSGSFCSIYWIKSHKPGLMHGLTFSNELISRDEGIHRDFALHMLKNRLLEPMSEDTAKNIIMSAVDIEKMFIKDALPVGVIGMNEELMIQYIEYVADHLFRSLGFENHIFGVQNPFSFMELISLSGKTNFFEKRVGDYQNAHVNKEKNHIFSIDEDF